MITREKAKEIAQDWIAAWNAHDLETILSHYAEQLEFVSPLVVTRLGQADGTITTKETLRAYFLPSLGADSELRFELLEVFAGVASLILTYLNHRRQTVAETMFLDDDGLAARVYVHHRPD